MNLFLKKSTTTDSNGNTIYIVTLKEGTEISYPEQKKGNIYFNLDSKQQVIFGTNETNNYNLPLIKQNFSDYGSEVSIYGLKNATIPGAKKISI